MTVYGKLYNWNKNDFDSTKRKSTKNYFDKRPDQELRICSYCQNEKLILYNFQSAQSFSATITFFDDAVSIERGALTSTQTCLL